MYKIPWHRFWILLCMLCCWYFIFPCVLDAKNSRKRNIQICATVNKVYKSFTSPSFSLLVHSNFFSLSIKKKCFPLPTLRWNFIESVLEPLWCDYAKFLNFPHGSLGKFSVFAEFWRWNRTRKTIFSIGYHRRTINWFRQTWKWTKSRTHLHLWNLERLIERHDMILMTLLSSL